MAAAAKTTPAVRCWTLLMTDGLQVPSSAAPAPSTSATHGMSVKIQFDKAISLKCETFGVGLRAKRAVRLKSNKEKDLSNAMSTTMAGKNEGKPRGTAEIHNDDFATEKSSKTADVPGQAC